MADIEQPTLHYFPTNLPGTVLGRHRELIDRLIAERELTALLLQTSCSGAVPPRSDLGSDETFATWLPGVARQVPIFLIPDAPQPQRYPWRFSRYAEDVGCIPLETACSAIADDVAATIVRAFQSSPTQHEAVQLIRATYRQER